MLKRILFIVVFIIIPTVMLAGPGKIKGRVIDRESKEPLIGASVAIVGTTQGAVTDIEGNYTILSVQTGTYTLKTTYVGYQTITVSNVRVNTDLTTEQNFSLPVEGVQVPTVEIVAERPIVNKNATNAVRITTNDDIKGIPVRGVNNILALQPGVVVQDNAVFIRGGRLDEVGYYLEGVSITNKVAGGRAVTRVQDAIEEIQVQAGGYNAEFGGSNSGIIQAQLRSGTSDLKWSAEFQSDNLSAKSRSNAYDGNKTLGGYQYGYNELVATLSGPLGDNRFKVFGLFDYNYRRDQNPQPYPGINVGLIGDASSHDTINLVYPGGPVYGNDNQTFTYTGTFTADFNPVKFRLGGTYTAGTSHNPFSAARTSGNIANFMNTGRIEEVNTTDGSLSLKMTHLLNPTTYYEITGGYFTNTSNTHDPLLGDNFMAYGDSVANAAVGVNWHRSPGTTVVGRYIRPSNIAIYDFAFNAPGDVVADYIKFKRTNISLTGAFTSQLSNQHSIKFGGEYQRYTMRNYSLGNESAVALAGLLAQANAVTDAQKATVLINRGVNNFGYDVLGNEYDGSDFQGPKHPVFGALYLQDKIEFQDLIINAGLRWDYINSDSKTFKYPEMPDSTVDYSTGVINPNGLVDVPSFNSISPRLGLSFPVTDKTVFHTQYGKFVQQSRLRDIYQGLYATGGNLRGGFFIPAPVGFDVRPTRTTQYEIGFTQQVSDFASFDITGYYKDIQDQIVYDQVTTASTSHFGGYAILTNGDFATTKGIEMTLNMRRTKRLQLSASLSFNDAQGTGSFPNSNRGIVGAPLDGVTIFKPVYISPLEFNNAVRGDLNIDYHFAKGDGPEWLQQSGASLLFNFNSGHPYTMGIGGVDLEGDARDRQPIEPLNSSSTPWFFQVDLKLDKSFTLADRLGANVYLQVTNLLNAQNILNVFLRTGSTTDDGVLSDPKTGAKLIDTYGQQYAALYRAINIDYYEQYQNASGLVTAPAFYGPPRQIRLGVRLEY